MVASTGFQCGAWLGKFIVICIGDLGKCGIISLWIIIIKCHQ